MKVLFFLTSLGAGGTERSTALLLPELRTRGLECEVAVLERTDVGDERTVLQHGFALHHVTGRSLPQRVAAMRKLLREVEPDILHTAVFDADIVGRLAGWRSGVKVVSSLVNTSYDPVRIADANVSRWKLELARMIDGWTARHLTDRLHAVSEGVARANADPLRLPREKIVVVERGRDPDSLQPSAPGAGARVRSELGVDADTPLVLAVGRVEFQKSHVRLVEAMADIRDSGDGPLPVAVIAGRPGNASAAVAERIRDLGLEGNVLLLGHRSDVPDLLASADLFVLPSLYEGTAGVVLEAMAAGLPVVSSRVDGLDGILYHRCNALLVRPGDRRELAAGIQTLLVDPSLATSLACRAQADFHERFTLDRSADAMGAFYRSLAAPTATATESEETATTGGRLPDFVIIGAMKSGTTSVFNWLDEHPDVALPAEKEPGFFAAAPTERARSRYEALFSTVGEALTGEASTVYTSANDTEAVARRMAEVLPATTRFVYVLREPTARLRSHYAHEVRRNREHEPLPVAATASSLYAATSCYHDRLAPFLEQVGASRILLVDFEALIGDDDHEWRRLLDFLGLEVMPRPERAHNRADRADSFTRFGAFLWRARLLRRAGRFPAPVRRRLRSLAIGRSDEQNRLLETTDDRLDPSVVSLLDAQTRALRAIAAATADGENFRPTWFDT